MKKEFYKKILSIFVTFIVVFLAYPVFAIDFQINMAKIKLKMQAGWSDGGTIKVDNLSSDQALTIRLYVNDWEYSNQDGSKNFFPAGTLEHSCADWIKFYPAEIFLQPLSSKEINYVVAVPPGSTGGHYAVLFFEADAGNQLDEQKGVMVKVFNRLAALFYIDVEGATKKEAKLSDLNLKKIGDDLELSAVLTNTGDTEISAKGTFDIINSDGLVSTRGNLADIFLMPSGKANITGTSKMDNLLPGQYDVILTFDFEDNVLVKEYSLEFSDSSGFSNIKEVD